MTAHTLKLKLLTSFLLISFALLASNAVFAAKNAETPATVPVTAVVTVLGPKYTAPPPIGKDDVVVHAKNQRQDVTTWAPAQGERADLHLAILIDDGADVGPRLNELRHFVQTQPPSTSVGVFYASNGLTVTAAPFSTNHDDVAKKVRVTLGPSSTSVSIYLSLIDVIKKLQPMTGRREILVISDGHDRLRGDLESPDVDNVMSSAQKTGVVIHTLYTRVGRRLGSIRQNLAQSNLVKVAQASGGQDFFEGLDTPVSYTPFLNQLDEVLHNQYVLTFTAPVSAKKHGDFRALKVTTEQKDVSITAQSDVFVPGP